METSIIMAIVRGAARLLDIGVTLDRGSNMCYEQAAYNSFRRAWRVLGDDLARTIDKETGRLSEEISGLAVSEKDLRLLLDKDHSGAPANYRQRL